MVVQLSPRVEAEIERLVASGQYADAGEVIDEGVRLLAEREHARFLQLRALVREGFESGEAVELPPEPRTDAGHRDAWRGADPTRIQAPIAPVIPGESSDAMTHQRDRATRRSADGRSPEPPLHPGSVNRAADGPRCFLLGFKPVDVAIHG